MTEAVTTWRAASTGAEIVALTATVVDLETRKMTAFRTVTAPAVEVERRAAQLGAMELVMRARVLRSSVLLREGHTDEGGRLCHQALAWATEHGGSDYLIARAHRELSTFYRQVGDFADSLTHALKCVAHLTADDVPAVVRSRHVLCLAVILDDTGSTEEADRRFREGLDLATAAGDHELALYTLNNMAYTAFEHGDEPGALALIEHMHDVQVRTGEPFTANHLDTIARVDMMGERYDAVERALAPLVDGRACTVRFDEGDALAACMLTLAEARRLAGRFTAAQDGLDAAMLLCEERGLAAYGARVREQQAALYAATGRFQEAYEEHRAFHAEAGALYSAQRDSRARALQAVFEATEARQASEHFREMAHRDALTGLYNRRYVNERLPTLLGEASVRCTPLSLAIIDLDHFKRVNDTLSHSTGDLVLQHIAQLLEAATDDSAIAARMGGEEFLLIFPGVEAAEAERRCEQLRLRVRAYPWAPITGNLRVTTSIGVTTMADGRGTPSALLSQADRHLYAAKNGGRDRVIADERDERFLGETRLIR